MLKLYTFGFSHFSEKARWALDLSGLPYREHKLLPGPHLFTTLRLGRKSSVPLLVDGARVVQGSGAIFSYVQERCSSGILEQAQLSAARTLELETLVDESIGRGVQTIFYEYLLKDRKALTDIWVADGPSWSRLFYALSLVPLASRIRKMYRVHPEGIARAKQKLRETWAELDALLSLHPYLSGTEPGRVDVVVAALAAPICRPQEHPTQRVHYPAELEAFCAEFSDTHVARHCHHLYHTYRQPSQI